MINPVAFTVFGLGIKWYGILITMGMALGMFLATIQAKREGIEEESFFDILLWVLPVAVIGARLYYVLFELGYYKLHPIEILEIRNGGLAIHGGVIAAFLVGYIVIRKKKLSFWKCADIVAPSIILGQAIGRWGNFINQEAYGEQVSEAFISKFPLFIKNQMFIEGKYYQPTFLYESLWDISVFLLLILYRKKFKKADGELIGLYAIMYSLGRFVIEGMRTDSLMLGSFRIAQLVSLFLIILGAVIIFGRRIVRPL